MVKIVYLDNLPAQEGVSILENQNKIMMNVFGTTSLIFYISDIYGSWRAAKYYQPKKIEFHEK